jgi:hypothetical protein
MRLTDRLWVDVDAQLSVEVLGDSIRRPPSSVFYLISRPRFQKTLNFFLDLLIDFRWAALSFLIIKSRGPFLVKSVHPLVNHRRRHVVDLCNLGSRAASAAQEHDVGTDRDAPDFLALHSL